MPLLGARDACHLSSACSVHTLTGFVSVALALPSCPRSLPLSLTCSPPFLHSLRLLHRFSLSSFAVLGATVAVLTRGIYAMLRNDHGRSQKMMRYRVAFQLCTVGAVLGGVYWRAFKEGGIPLTVSGARGREAEDKEPRDRSYMEDARVADAAAATAAGRLGTGLTVSPAKGPLKVVEEKGAAAVRQFLVMPEAPAEGSAPSQLQ